jgi:hypothetical protein
MQPCGSISPFIRDYFVLKDTFVEPLKTDEYLSRSVILNLEYKVFLRTVCTEMTKASPDYSEMRNLFKVR